VSGGGVMVNWWDENVWYPKYAHDWWFVGFLAVMFVVLILGLISSLFGEEIESKEDELERRLTIIEEKMSE
jgi:hypothetical protein